MQADNTEESNNGVPTFYFKQKKNNLQIFKILEPYNEDKEDCLAW